MGQSFIWKRIGFNTFLSRRRGDKPLSMGEKPRRGLPVLLFLIRDASLLSSSGIALVRMCSANCANIHLKAVKIRLQCRRAEFGPWVGNIPWRREWQLAPVFLPAEFHGQRSLASFSSWGPKSQTQTAIKPPPSNGWWCHSCLAGTEDAGGSETQT